MAEMISNLEETSSTLTLLLGAIAAIALLVGGIGVMNIMLVSVLERTREIGIRKALGAKQQDIWIQFLLEATFLTLAGGVVGVGIGWAAAYVINYTGYMSTLVTADIVILAVSVAVAIGIFFGFYPAWNASRLNPIEALRSE
jgi:putative ABC transport system permease protein